MQDLGFLVELCALLCRFEQIVQFLGPFTLSEGLFICLRWKVHIMSKVSWLVTCWFALDYFFRIPFLKCRMAGWMTRWANIMNEIYIYPQRVEVCFDSKWLCLSKLNVVLQQFFPENQVILLNVWVVGLWDWGGVLISKWSNSFNCLMCEQYAPAPLTFTVWHLQRRVFSYRS